MYILNSRTSKVPALMHLLRDLVLPATSFSFSFSAKHVPGVHNEIADALSFSLAGVLAPSTSSKPSAHATPAAAPGSVNLSTLQERCVSFLLHALATCTYKSYASAQRKCYKFCVEAAGGKLQANGSPCPADEWTLCLSATSLADSLRAASIKVYLSAVHTFHIEYGFPDPLLNFPRLQRVVRCIKCLQGSASSEQPPITDSIMLVMFNSFDLALPEHCMFWAACNLAYFGFLQASEIMVPSANSFPPSDYLTLQDSCLRLFIFRRDPACSD